MGGDELLRFGKKGASWRVIFGHGVGGLGEGAQPWIVDAAQKWATDSRFADVEFLLPTAPVRRVGMLGGREMPAWFDCEIDSTVAGGWRVNVDHLNEAKEIFLRLATMEEEGGEEGTLARTFFIGFSNGGACALYTGLQTECAGIIALSSVIVAPETQKRKLLKGRETPVLLCFGSSDQYVSAEDAAATEEFIAQNTACLIEKRFFEGMLHTFCEDELTVCADFLASHIL